MMRLRKLSTGTWTVLTEETEDGTCEVLEELKALRDQKQTRATANGFVALWSRIPVEGPRGLGVSLYHQLDPENEIYEFIKGNHRMLCFTANGRVVVCSHLIRKTRQRIDPRDIERAASLRRRYLEAERTGSVEVFEE